jgi:hypothetical protein
MLVPLEGAGEDSQAGACVPADVDDGGFAEAADVQASAADPSCWLDLEGDRDHNSTLVGHVFRRKGTSNCRNRRVQSMCGASSHSQAATSGIEDKEVICTRDPVSVLVQMGGRPTGRWALMLAQVTKLSAPGQSAPFSLHSSQVPSKSTTIKATVLQLLPVVGEAGVQAKADEQLWHWGGQHLCEWEPGRHCRLFPALLDQVRFTYLLSSADLDQLFDDACLVLSTVPFLLPCHALCALFPKPTSSGTGSASTWPPTF